MTGRLTWLVCSRDIKGTTAYTKILKAAENGAAGAYGRKEHTMREVKGKMPVTGSHPEKCCTKWRMNECLEFWES